ncbi:hypothetical protein T09_9834 [Trichinella sp. T9]|nr:hypothetical protein T09_9834 [Trichinella sp. T9]
MNHTLICMVRCSGSALILEMNTSDNILPTSLFCKYSYLRKSEQVDSKFRTFFKYKNHLLQNI